MWTASVAPAATSWLPEAWAQRWKERLAKAPAVELDALHYWDVIGLGTGVMAPLTGFMNRTTVQAVLESWRLDSGAVFPLPITLPVPPEVSRQARAPVVGLVYQGKTVAAMSVEDVFWLEPEEEAKAVYGTLDPQHPGVRQTLGQSPVRLAGAVTLLEPLPGPVAPIWTPAAMRTTLKERGWRTVAAFQTRNPLHRAHEYLHKVVLEWVDGLVLHPLVGATKSDDVPVEVRWRVYQALLEEYYPQERVLLSGYPVAMRYAGPREAVFHAITRRNYGFTHFIVGRDHAGVGNYYPPDAAHKALARFTPSELGIAIIAGEQAFFCRRCQAMASSRTCPHDPGWRENLSGTRVRTALARGESLPPHLIRPEVQAILRQYYQSLAPADGG